MPTQIGYYDTLKSGAGKVFSFLASTTLAGTDGKTLTVTQDTSLDEAVAMSSKLTIPGAWTTPTFDAGDFTANGSMTWTVASGDRLRYAYNIIGKMMTIIFWIEASIVGGTPSDALYMLIPASKLSAGRSENMIRTAQAASTAGFARATPTAPTQISLYRNAAGENWAAGSTTVSGQITFEIN